MALGGAFRETLTRHAVLLKQAEAFRARPAEFASLLAERGGIGRKELDTFEDLHARASRHRRAATMRHVHRIKREVELAPARQAEPERRVNAAPAPDHAVQPAGTDTSPARPDVHTLYEAVRRDWNRLVDRASEASVPTFDMEGSEVLVARMRPLTEQPDLPAGTRQALAGVLEDHQRHAAALKHIEDWLSAGKAHMGEHEILELAAAGIDLAITEVRTYPKWRGDAGCLIAEGTAILSDTAAYGAHLDAMLIGKARVEREIMRLRRAIRRDGEYADEQKTRGKRSKRAERRDETAKQKRRAGKRQRKGHKRSQGGGISM